MEADQVVHTISIGFKIAGRDARISYSNDSWGSFPWTTIGTNDGRFWGLPTLRATNITEITNNGTTNGNWNSDRFRTASGSLKIHNFNVGFFLHTGEATGIETINGIRQFTGGNINGPNRSNGIIYIGFGDVKIGWDSEGIRHALQNRLAHDHTIRPVFGANYPWVLRVNRRPRFVFQIGNF